MPGTVVSKVCDSRGKASRSAPVKATPMASTNLRGGAEPIRAMIRSQRIDCWPSGVSMVMKPGSTLAGVEPARIVIRPAAAASVRALTLASLARAKSIDLLSRVTTLPWAASAIRPSAFSIPASPPPTTVMCSSTYSVGSSRLYWMCFRSLPGTVMTLGLPWVPMASTTVSARSTRPSVRVMVKSPLAPVTDAASAR